MIYQYLIDNYYDHIFAILYFLNLFFIIIAYKLGFARKIPLLKSIIVYIVLALGTVLIALFSSIAELPTVESLIIIVLVLAIYRFRLHRERKGKQLE